MKLMKFILCMMFVGCNGLLFGSKSESRKISKPTFIAGPTIVYDQLHEDSMLNEIYSRFVGVSYQLQASNRVFAKNVSYPYPRKEAQAFVNAISYLYQMDDLLKQNESKMSKSNKDQIKKFIVDTKEYFLDEIKIHQQIADCKSKNLPCVVIRRML